MNRNTGRLLLVEDDRTLMRSLQVCLRRDGWEVTGVDSVEEATRQLVRSAYDLVVTDYHLSTEKDGLALLAHLIRDAFSPPTILISGCRRTLLEDRARELGAFAFLRKPFDLDLFLAKCRSALNKEAPVGIRPARNPIPALAGPAGSTEQECGRN